MAERLIVALAAWIASAVVAFAPLPALKLVAAVVALGAALGLGSWGGPAVIAVSGAPGLLTGLILGVGQWLVLRKLVGVGALWIVATMAPVALGHALRGSMPLLWVGWMTGRGIGFADSGGLFGLTAAAVTFFVGILLGACQFLCLRRHLRAAAWWIVVTAITWVVVSLVPANTTSAVTTGSSESVDLGALLQAVLTQVLGTGLLQGSIFGSVSGLALLGLYFYGTRGGRPVNRVFFPDPEPSANL
jgi:hypothetical protein